MRIRLRAAALVLTLLASLSSTTAEAGLIHDYQLNGTLADALGGPDLVDLGGTLGPARFFFANNLGLQLTGALPNPGNYAIEIVFQLDAQSAGWVKLVDFKSPLTDNGLYWTTAGSGAVLGGVGFWPVAFSPGSHFTPGVDHLLVVSRDATTELLSVTVDGNLALSFTDTSGLGVFSANVATFFVDEFVEFGSGSVDSIRIFDSLVVPEPSAALLLGVGLMGSSRLRRWRVAARHERG